MCDLHSQHQACNKCMLPECCAARRDRAHPDDVQRKTKQWNNESKNAQRTHTFLHLQPFKTCFNHTNIFLQK